MELAVSETVLINVLVISSPIESQLLIGCKHQAHLATSLISQIVLLIEVLIIDKTLQTTIETSNGPCQFLAWTMIVSDLHITIQPSTNAQTDIGTLIVYWVLRIHTNQSTLGVLTIESALWTTQHIYTVQHIEMIIECRLRHQRYVIIINTYCRVINTRAYAANIHRRCETRAIARHYKRWYVLRKLTQIMHIELLQLLTTKHITANRLQA